MLFLFCFAMKHAWLAKNQRSGRPDLQKANLTAPTAPGLPTSDHGHRGLLRSKRLHCFSGDAPKDLPGPASKYATLSEWPLVLRLGCRAWSSFRVSWHRHGYELKNRRLVEEASTGFFGDRGSHWTCFHRKKPFTRVWGGP